MAEERLPEPASRTAPRARTGSSAPGRSPGPWSRGSAPSTRPRRSSLSPRSADVGAALAARFGNVRVAADNQAVVDAAACVVVATRPDVTRAGAGRPHLHRRPGRRERRRRCLRRRAAPGSSPRRARSRGRSRCPRWPRGRAWCPSSRRSPRPSRCSVGWARSSRSTTRRRSTRSAPPPPSPRRSSTCWPPSRPGSWAAACPRRTRARTSRELIRGLSDALAEEPDRELALLASDHATPGGLNEQVRTYVRAHGVHELVATALDDVARRVAATSR